MRLLSYLVLVVVLVVCLLREAHGQCPGGRCAATPSYAPAIAGWVPTLPQAPHLSPSFNSFQVTAPVERYRWVAVPGNDDQEALLEHGKQIGCWSKSGAYYRALNADGSWGPKAYRTPDGYWSRPVVGVKSAPAHPKKKMEDLVNAESTKPNFGMNYKPAGPKYTLCEGGKHKDIDRRAAMSLVDNTPSASDIPDDSKKFRLVFVGKKEDRTRALSDCEKLSEHIKSKVILHAYDPDSPIAKQMALVNDGKPTVYLQAPDGQILGRNLDGTWDTSRVEAIEETVKNYDPAKDADLRLRPKVIPNPIPDVSQIPGWVWGLAGGGLVLLLMRKKG